MQATSERRTRDRQLLIRMTPEERAEIEAAAQRDGMPVGTYVRSAALVAARLTAGAEGLRKARRKRGK